jgi:hypothetical protein
VWYTHCAVAARLREPTSIRAVTLSARAAHSGSRAARVRRFSVFVASDSDGADVAALKAELPLAFASETRFSVLETAPSAAAHATERTAFSASDGAAISASVAAKPVPVWTRLAVGEMDPDATEAEIAFPIAVDGVVALAIRLDAFHVQPDARARETPRCPRCTRHVTDRHGVCAQCHENVHQCRRCRNINYEHTDAFLCNECGHSRFARLEICLRARETRGRSRSVKHSTPTRAASSPDGPRY